MGCEVLRYILPATNHQITIRTADKVKKVTRFRNTLPIYLIVFMVKTLIGLLVAQ
jgi:hypothetical protein